MINNLNKLPQSAECMS